MSAQTDQNPWGFAAANWSVLHPEAQLYSIQLFLIPKTIVKLRKDCVKGVVCRFIDSFGGNRDMLRHGMPLFSRGQKV